MNIEQTVRSIARPSRGPSACRAWRSRRPSWASVAQQVESQQLPGRGGRQRAPDREVSREDVDRATEVARADQDPVQPRGAPRPARDFIVDGRRASRIPSA